MILEEIKSGNCSSDPWKRDKILADYAWFLPQKSGPEPVLIEACKKGDPKAQLKVYKYYRRQMFEISYEFVCNARTANEIVSESFMVAFERSAVINRKVDFVSLLKSIVEEKSAESRNRSKTGVPSLVTDRILVNYKY